MDDNTKLAEAKRQAIALYGADPIEFGWEPIGQGCIIFRFLDRNHDPMIAILGHQIAWFRIVDKITSYAE